MKKIDVIQATIDNIRTTTFPLEGFYVRDYMAEWLAACRERRPDGQDVDIINFGVELATYRQVALNHGAQMLLQNPEGPELKELPAPAVPFIVRPADVFLQRKLTIDNWRALRRLAAEYGMTTETVVHDGLRLLGATALAPDLRVTIAAEGENLYVPPANFLSELAPPPERLL